ncbi:hypothetical protein MC885_020990 [Smutsia gigantea]|nr:hypothetical protein MC885_020990 [Smutsia gigantea]
MKRMRVPRGWRLDWVGWCGWPGSCWAEPGGLQGALGSCGKQEAMGAAWMELGQPLAVMGTWTLGACGNHVPPPQPVSSLELEALRLSLSNAHAAQLELTQANLQKEKEAALTELRELLRGRHAQELALLHSRQRRELELAREEVARRCSEETAELKEKLRSEVEKNMQMVETLKQDWESEREACLENLRKELSEKHHSELENLQSQWKRGLAEQKAELENIFQARNQAESSPKALEAPYEAAVSKLHEDLQSEHGQQVDDPESKFREKQLELENLQASYKELKAQSQGEIRHLWSQLESARTSRQELSELHEQLLARVSHVEELEQLKQDFEQQQQQEKAEHESQLEQLRLCFEEKLRDAEENYQEDVTLLQQRLRVVKEDCLPEPVKHNLVEDHQEELKEAKEKIQLMKEEFKEREAEWKVTSEDLKRKAEGKLTLMLRDLREQAESEKQSIINRFELRETEMRQLQDRQAAQILDLEGTLKEQQGRLRQLELGLTGDESPQCSQCGREPGGSLASADHDRELNVLHLKEDCALQRMLAQNSMEAPARFLGEPPTAEERGQSPGKMCAGFSVACQAAVSKVMDRVLNTRCPSQNSDSSAAAHVSAAPQHPGEAQSSALAVGSENVSLNPERHVPAGWALTLVLLHVGSRVSTSACKQGFLALASELPWLHMVPSLFVSLFWGCPQAICAEGEEVGQLRSQRRASAVACRRSE